MLEEIILIREENRIPDTHRNLNQTKSQHKLTNKKASTQKEEINFLRPQLHAHIKGSVKCKGDQQKSQIEVRHPKRTELTQH